MIRCLGGRGGVAFPLRWDEWEREILDSLQSCEKERMTEGPFHLQARFRLLTGHLDQVL
jgi:hypothetical protein